jgi:hypothetical protein
LLLRNFRRHDRVLSRDNYIRTLFQSEECEQRLAHGEWAREKSFEMEVIRPVSSQLAEFLRLAPTPASSD